MWGFSLTTVTAANVLDPARNVTFEDFKPYAERVLVNALFSKYARLEWQ